MWFVVILLIRILPRVKGENSSDIEIYHKYHFQFGDWSKINVDLPKNKVYSVSDVKLRDLTGTLQTDCVIWQKCVHIKSNKTNMYIGVNNLKSGSFTPILAAVSQSVRETKWDIDKCHGFYIIRASNTPYIWTHSGNCKQPSEIIVNYTDNISNSNTFRFASASGKSLLMNICNKCLFIDDDHNLKSSTNCSGKNNMFYITKPSSGSICSVAKGVYFRSKKTRLYLGVSELKNYSILETGDINRAASKGSIWTILNYDNYSIVRHFLDSMFIWTLRDGCTRDSFIILTSNTKPDEYSKLNFTYKISASTNYINSISNIYLCNGTKKLIILLTGQVQAVEDFDHYDDSALFLTTLSNDETCTGKLYGVYIKSSKTGAYIGTNNTSKKYSNTLTTNFKGAQHFERWNLVLCAGYVIVRSFENPEFYSNKW